MKKYLFLLAFIPVIVKSQNVGINTITPAERLQLNGSFLITPTHPDNDTIKNSTVGLATNTNYILTYNASKAALHFGYSGGNQQWNNSNTGFASLAFGGGAQASGYGSLAYGYNSTASGGNSTALGGNMNLASGYSAVAGGDNSIASGQTSIAFGENIIVRRTSGAGFGMYNDTTHLATTLFSIGNGTAINVRANALTVLDNGNTGMNTANPNYALEVVDQGTFGSIAHFRSNNPTSSFVNIQNTAGGTNTASIGFAIYRAGVNKGLTYVDNSNNYIMSIGNTNTGFLCITPSGNIGIGTATSGAKLQVQQKGLYSRSEGQGNALELWDSSGTGDGIMYMGADNTNGYGYIQAVATGSFRDLLLQGRGGSVIIGKDQASSLQVKGDVVVDYPGSNSGTIGNSLRFGGSGSGEGIASKRNAGGNVYGLDFYTNSNRRMGVSNTGDVDVVNNLTVSGGKGIIRSNNGVQLKRVTGTVSASFTVAAGDTLGFGSSRFFFPEIFSTAPTVYCGGINSVSSGAANVPIQLTFYDITTSSCRAVFTNPTKYSLSFNLVWNVVMEGPQ